MPVKVYLTQMLVRHLDISPELTVDAESLGSLIDVLEGSHRGFRDSICDESGRIRAYVNVFLNGEKLSQDSGALGTPLSNGDELYILASVAGGNRLSWSS